MPCESSVNNKETGFPNKNIFKKRMVSELICTFAMSITEIFLSENKAVAAKIL